MFGLLAQEYDPYHYDVILTIILGPDKSGDPAGTPQKDAVGNAIAQSGGGYVGRVRRQNNDASTTFREARPLDPIIGGTAGNYSTTVTAGALPTQVCGTTTVAAKIVPQGQGILVYGWYLDGDLSEVGYVQVYVNGNLRQELSGPEVFNNPWHHEIVLTQLAFAAQGDNIAFEGLNGGAADVKCMMFPMTALIGPASQLGFDTGAH